MPGAFGICGWAICPLPHAWGRVSNSFYARFHSVPRATRASRDPCGDGVNAATDNRTHRIGHSRHVRLQPKVPLGIYCMQHLNLQAGHQPRMHHCRQASVACNLQFYFAWQARYLSRMRDWLENTFQSEAQKNPYRLIRMRPLVHIHRHGWPSRCGIYSSLARDPGHSHSPERSFADCHYPDHSLDYRPALQSARRNGASPFPSRLWIAIIWNALFVVRHILYVALNLVH